MLNIDRILNFDTIDNIKQQKMDMTIFLK